jgi:hypothetical protein
MRAICPAHLIPRHFVRLITSGNDTNYESPHCPTYSIVPLLLCKSTTVLYFN